LSLKPFSSRLPSTPEQLDRDVSSRADQLRRCHITTLYRRQPRRHPIILMQNNVSLAGTSAREVTVPFGFGLQQMWSKLLYPFWPCSGSGLAGPSIFAHRKERHFRPRQQREQNIICCLICGQKPSRSRQTKLQPEIAHHSDFASLYPAVPNW